MAQEQLLTPREVAYRLGFKLRWFYAHAHEFIPYGLKMISGCYRMPESGLERWVRDHDELASGRLESAGNDLVKEERARLSGSGS
jgi:hypothetical protein